jgi:hypothetical protein
MARKASSALFAALAVAVLFRFSAARAAAWRGDVEPMVAFGFVVIFPSVLVALLLGMPPTRSVEGVWMRIAAAIDLIAIVCFPSWGLLLLLGLPVTFLCVEILETRAPDRLREIAQRLLVRS